MRNIYIFFIAFFVVFGLLEWQFKPDASKVAAMQKPMEQAAFVHTSEKASTTDEVSMDAMMLDANFLDQAGAKADTISWKLLGIIKYTKKPHPDFEEGVMFPIINSTLKAKQGKKVVLSGFIVPVDTKTYALSKNVFAACFFCGKAGPETITGLKFKGATPKLKTDQYVTIEGIFRYNDSDVDDWIYHIDQAVITKGL